MLARGWIWDAAEGLTRLNHPSGRYTLWQGWLQGAGGKGHSSPHHGVSPGGPTLGFTASVAGRALAFLATKAQDHWAVMGSIRVSRARASDQQPGPLGKNGLHLGGSGKGYDDLKSRRGTGRWRGGALCWGRLLHRSPEHRITGSWSWLPAPQPIQPRRHQEELGTHWLPWVDALQGQGEEEEQHPLRWCSCTTHRLAAVSQGRAAGLGSGST